MNASPGVGLFPLIGLRLLPGLLFLSAPWISGAVAAPANDRFRDATILAGDLPLLVEGSLAGATVELLEPDGAEPSVWWTWSAPRTEWLSLTRTGDAAVMAVYEGGAVDTLGLRSVTNPLQPARRSWVRVEAGHHYHLRLTGTGLAAVTIASAPPPDAGPFDLSGPLPLEREVVILPDAAKDELPEGAWGLAGYRESRTGNGWATTEQSVIRAADWVCPEDGVYVLESQYDGGSHSAEIGAEIINDEGAWTAFRAAQGQSVRISLRLGLSGYGAVRLRLSALPRVDRAVEEMPGDLPFTVSHPMVAVPAEDPLRNRFLWLPVEWVATRSGWVQVTTSGSAGVLEVRSDGIGPVSQVFGTTSGGVWFPALSGNRYMFFGRSGLFQPWNATVAWAEPVTNDTPETALEAGAEGSLQSASALVATATEQEKAWFAPAYTTQVVWWRWTAPTGGPRVVRSGVPARVFAMTNGQLAPISSSGSPVSFDATAGVTYWLAFATALTYSPAVWAWSLAPSAPATPVNLEILMRTLWPGHNTWDGFSIPEPAAEAWRAVFWEWTAPDDGEYSVIHDGPVFRRDSAGAWQAVILTPGLPNRRRMVAEKGSLYSFRTAPSLARYFSVQVSWVQPPHPPMAGSAAEARDLGDALPAIARRGDTGDVWWWKWRAPRTETITLAGAGFGVAAFDENLVPVEAPVLLWIDGPALQALEATAGQVYYFRTPPSAWGYGNIGLTLRRVRRASVPHDAVAGALDLGSERSVTASGQHGSLLAWSRFTGSHVNRLDDLELSSLEPGEPAHAPVADGATIRGSLWWKWTAPRTETMLLSHATPLELFAGTSLADLHVIPFTPGPGESDHTFAVTAGTTYFIAALRTAASAVNKFSFALRALTDGPVNDAWADRLSLLPVPSEIAGDFVFPVDESHLQQPTNERGEPPAVPIPGGSQSPVSLWWRWHCPATGFYRLQDLQTGNAVPAGLSFQLFTGESLATLQPVPGNEEWGQPALAGREYSFALYLAGPLTNDGPDLRLHLAGELPYQFWVRGFDFARESDLLPEADSAGDGLTNSLRFFCGIRAGKDAVGDPTTARAPVFITRPDGSHAIRFKLQFENAWAPESSYWNLRGRMERSSDLIHWTDADPSLEYLPVDDAGFAEVPLPPPVPGARSWHRLRFFMTYDP